MITQIVTPNGFALVRVCGNILLSTKSVFFFDALYANIIASAAAVASSNNDALVIGNPVNSVIKVFSKV